MIIWNLLPSGPDALYTTTYSSALWNIARKYNIEYHREGIIHMDEVLNFRCRLPK